MAVERIEVMSDNLAAWGVQVFSYGLDNNNVDFQDLMIKITEQRATTVEKEIAPMSTRMTKRNKNLEYLGEALAVLSGIATKFTEDDRKDQKTKYSDEAISDAASKGLQMVGFSNINGSKKAYANPAQAEEYQQKIKTKMDALNNQSSKDMTRLQSLVDKRDESYSTATSLMQSIADMRQGTIKNM